MVGVVRELMGGTPIVKLWHSNQSKTAAWAQGIRSDKASGRTEDIYLCPRAQYANQLCWIPRCHKLAHARHRRVCPDRDERFKAKWQLGSVATGDCHGGREGQN